MAVPPAPDGNAVGDPSDSTDTTTSTGPTATATAGPRRPLWILVALFAVVLGCLLASLVALGRAGWSVDDLVEEQTNPQTQRDQVMTSARTFVTVFSTYGPEDLDEQNAMPGYVDRVSKLMTSKFASEFERGVTFAEQTVVQGKVSREAEVYAVAVSRLDDDSARVLVSGVDRTSVPNPDDPEEQVPYGETPFRYEVDLVFTQGEWLVDNFGVVGTLDEPAALPTEPPATAPSTPAQPGDGEGDGGTGQGGEGE